MFKRVEKRRRRKEEEEALGLDEDMKEVLGIQDTDSDESDSDSEADPDSADEQELEEIEEIDEEEVLDVEGKPRITVGEALKDTIYLDSPDDEIHACILCPTKVLKGVEMIATHKTSRAHIRRFAHFTKQATEADPESNAWELIPQDRAPVPVSPTAPSKRSLKKQVRIAKIQSAKAAKAAKRAKALQLPKEGNALAETRPPSKKKRKLKDDEESSLLSDKAADNSPVKSKVPKRLGEKGQKVKKSRPQKTRKVAE